MFEPKILIESLQTSSQFNEFLQSPLLILLEIFRWKEIYVDITILPITRFSLSMKVHGVYDPFRVFFIVDMSTEN